MNSYHNLLYRISRDMNILKGSMESQNSWKARIVYSAIGQMALASLYDVQEDAGLISVTHFKRRIQKLYDSYLSMYPELKPIFLIQAERFSDEIYNIYLQTGHIYHSSNRIAASVPRVAQSNRIMLMRGTALKQQVFRSGLGAYLPGHNTVDSVGVKELFCLHSKLSDFWKRTVSNITWSEITLPAQTKYLRTAPPFNRGYFKELPDKDGRISILQTGVSSSYLYYFYTYRNDTLLGMQIPSWQVDNNEYRMLSNSCIYSEGNLPPAMYHVDQNIVSLRLQYLYPPSEQNIIRLYGWPVIHNEGFSGFQFILAVPVFFAIKSEFEKIGFSFTEE